MEDTPTPSPVVSWTVHEFEQKDRHPDWVWYVGLVFAIGATLSFFYGNIFFGILLIVAGAVMIIYALREPKLLTIATAENGLTVNGELIPFDRITQFWLDETEKPDKLLLRVKGSFVPTISLPLEGISTQAVRAALKEKAKEEQLRESSSVKLFERIGF